MMASPQETLVAEVYRCYHCGFESTDSSFKYFNNKKADQSRYQCQQCHKLFTLGTHGRPQGKTYAKKRNEDPEELKGLSRQCCRCGVADHALFKYYNNKSLSQPRFQCLSCGNQFQMRLMGTGEERRLVHTSPPRRQKQPTVPEQPLASTSNSYEEGSYQPCDGSFMPVPFDPLMPLEPGARLLPETRDEDAEYAELLEAELAEVENTEDAEYAELLEAELAEVENTEEAEYTELLEAELAEVENTQADPLTWTTNGDDGNLLSPLSNEADVYSHFLEAGLLTEENIEAPNPNAFFSTATVDGEWPQAWSNEDAQFMNFTEASEMAPDVEMVSDHMAEMVSESTSDNAEVMYGTLVVDKPPSSDSESWSSNDTLVDPSGVSYADTAAACCYQMDLDMAHENSVLAVDPVQSTGSECSSSSASSTTVFGDSFSVVPEPLSVEHSLVEDDQCSDFQWNGDDEAELDTEMGSWASWQ